ncbi:MAG: squalene synthase HpnC [Planctomycetota bacterium]
MSARNSSAPNRPNLSAETIGLEESRRFCKRLATSHYENFLVCSILLPRRLRQPFYSIYAFCRTADDIADESGSSDLALGGLADLQRRVDWLFDSPETAVEAIHEQDRSSTSRPDGGPKTPSALLCPALSETIATFGLSKQPFDDLLSAFRQDQHQTEYESESDLLDYCRRSANPVGRMILELADCCDVENAALSDEICTGLQLANFWQDVSRDYAIGRIYLPREERRAFGVDVASLAGDSTPPALRDLLRVLCERAEQHFRRGLPLAERVPRWLAADIKLFAHGGLETLAAIRRIQFDCLRIRPTVPKLRQMGLVARAMVGLL